MNHIPKIGPPKIWEALYIYKNTISSLIFLITILDLQQLKPYQLRFL